VLLPFDGEIKMYILRRSAIQIDILHYRIMGFLPASIELPTPRCSPLSLRHRTHTQGMGGQTSVINT